MDAVVHAHAATLGAARLLPRNFITVLGGAAGLALAAWLAAISRSFRDHPGPSSGSTRPTGTDTGHERSEP